MNEHEWDSSDDVAAMLHQLLGRDPACATDRKLRLFALSCHEPDFYWRAWADRAYRNPGALDPLDAALICAGCKDPQLHPMTPAERGRRAALLRCLVGNPFRPVTLPYLGARGVVNYHPSFPVTLDGDARCPWLTPQVLTLARAAYECRPGRHCYRCNGAKHYQDDERRFRCPDCGGTGTIDDGSLDPLTLLALADALEEVGCPAEQESPCPACSQYVNDPESLWPGQPGYRPERDPASGRHEGGWTNCKTCNSGGPGQHKPGFVRGANPLLAHLRSPGPHCRGCHALDAVLGLS